MSFLKLKKKCVTASCADQHLFNCNPSVCSTPDVAKYCPLTCGSCSAGKNLSCLFVYNTVSVYLNQIRLCNNGLLHIIDKHFAEKNVELDYLRSHF